MSGPAILMCVAAGMFALFTIPALVALARAYREYDREVELLHETYRRIRGE